MWQATPKRRVREGARGKSESACARAFGGRVGLDGERGRDEKAQRRGGDAELVTGADQARDTRSLPFARHPITAVRETPVHCRSRDTRSPPLTV